MSVRARYAKSVTRRTLRLARADRDDRAAAAVEASLAAGAGPALGAAGVRAPASVAVYRSLPGEPGTGALREELRRAGHRVLLPVLLADRDLDWVEDIGGAAAGHRPDGSRDEVLPGATPEDPLRPAGRRLGVGALRSCALVLVPALAVDAAGTRLGQGGGSYDRALARLDGLASRPLVLAVLHDDEVLADLLPREPHDVGVDGALTPAGLVLLGR